MAKARHSERDGKWDDNLVCRIQRLTYDYCTRTGRLDFPEANCCDMTGAVRLVTGIDPDARVIETFAGGEPDVVYRRNLGTGEWTAVMMAAQS